MALPKNVRFTKLSGTELGVAIFLALLSLIIGFSAYRDFVVHYYFGEALVAYGSSEEELVMDRCEKAMGARPQYRFPHLLWAKMKVDSDALDKAEKAYREITAKYKDLSATPDVATAHIGLAVVALRKYDGDKNAELLKTARAELDAAAKANPVPAEVFISLGHLELRQGNWDAAAKQFDAAKQAQTVPTIDGLIDLYTGLGVIDYKKQRFPEARDNFRRAYELNPGRPIPLANTVYLEAQFYGGDKVTREHLEDELIHPVEQLLRDMKDRMMVDPEKNEVFRLARYSLMCSLASALIRNGRFQQAEIYLEQAIGEEKVPREIACLLRAERNWVESRMEGRQPHELIGDQEKICAAYESVLKLEQQGWDSKIWSNDAKKRAKANILNNLAVLWYRRKMPDYEDKCADALDRAIALFPEDADYIRNRGAVHHSAKGEGYKKAILDYEKALELYKKDPKANERKIKEIEDALNTIRTGESGG